MAGPTVTSASGSLSANFSSEQQMLAAAADELAYGAAPLARLALPTASEGLANVLQVSSYMPQADVMTAVALERVSS